MRSLLTLSIGLAENVALLLSLTVAYGLLWRYVNWRRFRIRSLITGSLFGIIAILGMLTPIRVGPGVIVDGRVVIVALAGAFNGPAAAATAATLVSAYRLWLGGAGALPGVGAILTAMALGAFVHRRWAGQVRRFGPRKFLLLGAALTVSGLLWTLTLPDADLRWRVLALLAPSVGIFFPLETLLLGLLLSNFHEERERLTLTEFSIDQSADAIFWVTPTGKLARFNPAAARLCGVQRGESLSMRAWEAGLVPSEAAWSALWEDIRERGATVAESELRARNGGAIPVEISSSFIRYEGAEYACLFVRDISERKRAEEALRRYADRHKILHEIDQSILAAHSPEAIAGAALRHLRQLVPCARAGVVLFDPETDEALVFAARVDGETRIGPGVRLAVEDVIGDRGDLRQGQGSRIEDTLALSEPLPFVRALRAEGVRSCVNIPLVARGELIGVLNLGKRDPGVFAAEHLEIAREVADLLAVAIQQARLYEAEQHARQIAETLRAASLALTRTLDLDTVLATSLDSLSQLVPSDGARVLLLEADARPVRLAVRGDERWAKPDPSQSLTDDAGDHVGVREVLATQGSVLVADTDERPGWPRHTGARPMRNWLGVPLVVAGDVIGLYSMEKAEPGFFAPEHIRLAEALAAQAAVAIQNARLFEEVGASRKRLETLSHRLTQVQEAERRFIARELHDEIGQVLTGLKLAVEMSARTPADAVSGGLREIEARVNELIGRIRELSLDLRPAMLDDLGVLPTLLWHFERYASQTQVRVTFKHTGVERRFPPEVETAVYRIVQEGLTNVARHAGVSEATVRLWAGEHALGVQVEDKGTGFDARAVLEADASSGIAGMRERARLLGGEVTVESVPGAGTCLTAEFPLSRGEREGTQDEPDDDRAGR